ncbi:MAG: phosphoenolpyruvate synthase [Anaerocolumna sp.]|jgi:pyruvate,water dikinase|nr:phosphoenolpyruvate synthase [Anaerocolumna sp.]
MSSYVLHFGEIDKTKIIDVGGKGANLGELSRIPGIMVTDGFCITTAVFKRITKETASIHELINQISQLTIEDRVKIAELSGKLRRNIEALVLPDDIVEEITHFLNRYGEMNAYAIRSSATAEDLPTASFAGQQDTYLNIIGKDEILKNISKCFASLFTERAIMYRIQNGFSHRNVYLSVVVQKMVFPKAAGILFTADPITSNRLVSSIDASFGLGEALVSGLVNADNYKVRNGKILDKKIFTKKLAIYPSKKGGTKEQEIDAKQQNSQVLTDEQIIQLEQIGRKVEAHFGNPQDIEWCFVDDTFYIVQSRPITTLYPIPEANDDENHVYLSVGHQQMMTDPLKPLGMSIFILTSFGPRYRAGGRLFVDVTPILTSLESRKTLIDAMGQHDPLMKDALLTILERDNFIELKSNEKQELSSSKGNKIESSVPTSTQLEIDPEIVTKLINSNQTSIKELKHTIETKSGTELFDFILEDIKVLKKDLFDQHSMGVITAASDALAWINENVEKWIGEKNVADTLSLSVSNNITSEMGLELLDVADVIRPFPEVINFLQQVKDDNFLDELIKFPGGLKAKDAILSYLNKYGMRCVGEIDITRTRWSEKPSILIPMILQYIKNFEPNASKQKFEQGLKVALEKEQELIERIKQLSEGDKKANDTKRMIDIIRTFSGYREYPKYGIVSRYFIYKQAIFTATQHLVQTGIIHEIEDIYYLTFEELREVVDTKKLDYQVINKRKEEFKLYEKLTPPRVITSDGEIITGSYKRDNVPAGAIVGLPVSSGFVEGRARVILKLEDADLEDGDILVTTFTDPSWTPLFVSIKGLITEVGGMMTHGAVIAREYGLPAIVGVENATKVIKDGSTIRINGIEGYVEILS